MFSTAQHPGKLDELPTFDPDSGLVNVVIDTPRDSRCKYRYADRLGLFRLGKLLPLGTSFPYDFGFVPSTAAEDGDPLDVLVILSEPVAVGCVATVRMIGVLKAEQTERDGTTVENDRLIGVVETEFNEPEFHSLDDLGQQRLDEIQHFFESYNEMEGKRFRSLGYRGEEDARRLIERARRKAELSEAAPEEQDAPPEQPKPGGNGFRLKPDEAAGKGMKRIVSRQLKRALEELDQSRSGEEQRVHDVRKRFKKLRAALRLVRSEVGKRKYRQHNSAFRDAAHAFNDVRDARVLVDSLKRLAKQSGNDLPEEELADLNELLKSRARQAFDHLLDSDEMFESVTETLKQGRKKIDNWRLGADDWCDLSNGLERIYQQSFDAFAAAKLEQSTANLHEWRKQVKYFWHELQILEAVWPEGIAEFGDRVHELTRLLGDDHDLAMLQQTLDSLPVSIENRAAFETFSRAIAQERVKLQSHAMQIGGGVFQEDSAGIKRRVKAAQ